MAVQRVVQKIVVVDDDRKYLELARRQVPDRGVITVCDARTVHEVMGLEQPDAVVVDLHLGGDIQGDEIVNELKALDRDRPVILVSAGFACYPVLRRWFEKNCLADIVDDKALGLHRLIREIETGEVSEPDWNNTPSFLDKKIELAGAVIARCRGNLSGAARELGVSRSTLVRLLRRDPETPLPSVSS